MDKRKALIMGIVLLVIALGGAWSMGYFRGTDPAVAELQQMRGQMFDDKLPEADRQRMREEFRTKMDGLSEGQRQQFFQNGREQWQQQAQRRMDEFFKMAPKEQQKQLDEMIDRMVQRQKERAQNPNANNGRGGGSGGGGGQGGAGQGRGGGGRNMTQAQRDQRSKERIAQTDPKVRAQRDVYRQMMGDRMKQRGITPPAGGGGFPGGGRG